MNIKIKVSNSNNYTVSEQAQWEKKITWKVSNYCIYTQKCMLKLHNAKCAPHKFSAQQIQLIVMKNCWNRHIWLSWISKTESNLMWSRDQWTHSAKCHHKISCVYNIIEPLNLSISSNLLRPTHTRTVHAYSMCKCMIMRSFRFIVFLNRLNVVYAPGVTAKNQCINLIDFKSMSVY